MSSFLWEIYQQQRIADANAAGNKAERNSEALAAKLNSRIDALVLVNMAMWSLIQERLGLTDADLEGRIRELDLRDGRLDGRSTPQVSTCAACGRTLSIRHNRCLYCGSEALKPAPFRETL